MVEGWSRRRVRACLTAVNRGRFAASEALLARLEASPGPEARGFAVALRVARWLAGLERELPETPTLEADAGEAPEALAAACEPLGRASALAFDLQGLDHWVEVGARIDPQGRFTGLRVLRALRDVLAGALGPEIRHDLQTLAEEATDAKLGHLVVETLALQALVASERGNLEEATQLALRASRQARSQAMPQPEYFASIVLARVRRRTGRTHLASRILRGLAEVAPPPWHDWLAWETLLSAGPAGAEAVLAWNTVGPAASARLLDALLQAAAAGDRSRFDATAGELEDRVRLFRPAATDLALVRVAVDPEAPDQDVPKALGAFRRGDVRERPFGLAGLAGDQEAPEMAVCVCAAPGVPAVRLLRLGASLFAGPEAARQGLAQDGRPGRTEATLCVLAFAGPDGMGEGELFAEVYGLDYSRELHGGVLDVLLQRAGARLGDAGVLRRETGRVSLELRQPILLPDPRCVAPIEEQVFRFVARHGRSTARDASRALAIPLPSAQEALRALVSDGSCAPKRAWRRMHYQVENATFRAPTRR